MITLNKLTDFYNHQTRVIDAGQFTTEGCIETVRIMYFIKHFYEHTTNAFLRRMGWQRDW